MSLTATVSIYVSGAWSDITSDVLSSNGLSCEGGMRTNKPTDRIASPSRFTFSLKNNDGQYTPDLSGSLTGWGKGTKVKVDFTHNITTRTKFIGYVDSIKISLSNNNVVADVVASSWMKYAVDQPINNPPLQIDKRADQAISEIVSVMPIQPEDTSYATGTNTFPYIFHDASIKTRAYSEFTKIALSEWGYIYDKADGTLVLESYTSRDTPEQKNLTYYPARGGGFLIKSDGGYIKKSDGGKILLSAYTSVTEPAEIDNEFSDVDIAYGEHIVNRATVTAHPYQTGDEEILVYDMERPRTVLNGTTTSFTVQFSDLATGKQVAALPPTTDTRITLLHLDTQGILDEGRYNRWTNVNADSVSSPSMFDRSLYFDGSAYLYAPSSSKFNLGTSDFTIEWWEYRTDESVGRAVISRSTTGNYMSYALGVSDLTNSKIYMSSNGSSWDIANGKTFGPMIFDEWAHYAVTRSGTTFRAYKNGTLTDSWTSSASLYTTTNDMSIGKYNGYYFDGYLDEIRIIKGEAVYTDSSFEVPTEPFSLTGAQYMVWTGSGTTGTDLTESVTIDFIAGGAGINVSVTNSSGSNGILWPLKIYVTPVVPGTQETYSNEDDASVLDYGYQQESIEQRYQQDVDFGAVIVDDLVTAEKEPRIVLNSITADTGRSEKMKSLFTQIDIGDVVSIVEPNIEKDALFYVQGVTWRAMPAQEGVHVSFKWILKEV